MRRRIKGATCGHIWHIDLLLQPQGVYCWVRVYISTAGSISLSQGCIFRQLVVEWVYIAAQLINLQLQHRKTENLFLQWKDNFPPVLTRRATATTTEPSCTVFSIYCTTWAQQPKRLANFRAATQCLLGVLNHTWLADHYCFLTASHNLTDGDDNFWLAKQLIQDSTGTTVFIWWVVATNAGGTERLGVLLPARIIVLWSPASKNG